MTPMELELHAARNLHAGATRRAARVWRLLKTLSGKRLFIPAGLALNEAANGIYFNASYDASERYSDVEEFKESLVEDLNKAFERETHPEHGDCYVVRPFFAKNTDFLRFIGLGYICGYMNLEEVAGLDVAPVPPTKETGVTGLTEAEAKVLIDHHRRSAITLLNLMFKTATAMHYVRTGVANNHNTAPSYAGTAKDEGIDATLVALSSALELPYGTEVPTHFSSDKKVLKNVPELLASVLTAEA